VIKHPPKTSPGVSSSCRQEQWTGASRLPVHALFNNTTLYISLELNIRQRILSDLATVETETEDFLIILNQSKAQVGGEKHSAHNCDSGEDEVKFRGFMVRARSMYVR